tara:strand:+ start:165 stop:701 length:537 start_codon:yes stop_codon:yes gene_type:complete
MPNSNTQIDLVEETLAKAIKNCVRGKNAILIEARKHNKKWTDFLSPYAKDNGSTCTKLYWDDLRYCVTLGWSADKRAYWETPSKELDGATFNDNGRAKTKSDLTREIGSFIKDVKNALQREQEPKRERAEPRTPLELFWDHIHKAGDILANKNPFDDANVFKKIDQAFADIYDANENN